MDLIYTEPYSTQLGIKEIGYLPVCKLDVEIGTLISEASNDFEITIDLDSLEDIKKESLVYANDGSEIGGVVYGIKVDTQSANLTLKCKLWRGMLNDHIIKPPDGVAYYEFGGDANTVIRNMLDDHYNGVIKGSPYLSGINVSGKVRYNTVLKTIEDALTKANARIKISFKDGCAICEAVSINDLSDKISLDNDYGIPMVAEDSDNGYNHIIALGQGELIERQIVELWRLSDDSITDNPKHPNIPKGIQLRSYIYDYPSVETPEELLKEAYEKLDELSPTRTLEIEPSDLNVEIGDIVSASERITGISMKKQITRKIIKGEIRNGISFLTTEYKVGD